MSLPLQPSEVPLRVFFVSPFTKDEKIIQKAKIAAMKKNYIIDPKAIEQTLNFWKEVGNKVMAKAEFNKANCEQLPINDVSPSMFTMTSTDNEEAETEVDGSSHEVAEEKEYSSGGSSLLRTNKEVEEIVIIAATVTIGGDTPAESNVHGKVVEAFPDKVNLATQMGRISTHIDVLLSNILPPSGQLNLFLSDSGGTEPNSNHIQAWSEISFMFLDEFSMIKPSLYSLTNNRLQKIKGRFDKPFGGVHVISSGDFYQFSPIGSFIFQTPTQYENEKDGNAIESMRGRHLWKTELTDVIELTENHRQTTDRPWADSLERWRINQPTDDDIAAVNNRFVDDLDLSFQRPPPQTIIAVTQNDHRETGMRYFETRIKDAVSGILSETDHDWRRRRILLVQAHLSQTEGHQKVRPQQQNYIRGMN
ncbi:Uncharacterized protein APZ42_033970 [Daphnia magna]|uniref:ATP-dependent DNA helicase n=1 Tax=Daphnia magna TaxID=35525 RepID=A0A164KK34_9CRUS|nr:Uncharacterized protein APZ42_033970 [Daphnia magna]